VADVETVVGTLLQPLKGYDTQYFGAANRWGATLPPPAVRLIAKGLTYPVYVSTLAVDGAVNRWSFANDKVGDYVWWVTHMAVAFDSVASGAWTDATFDAFWNPNIKMAPAKVSQRGPVETATLSGMAGLDERVGRDANKHFALNGMELKQGVEFVSPNAPSIYATVANWSTLSTGSLTAYPSMAAFGWPLPIKDLGAFGSVVINLH